MKLKPVGTRLREHDATMELLGKLPNLEILFLGESWSSFQCEELDFQPQKTEIAFQNLRVLTLEVEGTWTWNIKSVKLEGAMPNLQRLEVTGRLKNEIDFSGLMFLQKLNEVHLRLLGMDDQLEGIKKQIQEQLSQNTSKPIVTLQ